MTDHVYKSIQLTGTSPNSIEDAVQNAISKASKTIQHIRWFEIIETRGNVQNGKIGQWQVTFRLGFTLE